MTDRQIEGGVVRGTLGNMVRAIADHYKIDFEALRTFLYYNFKALADKKHCPNCGASMEIDEYKPDSTDAALLIAMGKQVKENMKKGMDFTDANLIHVYTLPITDAMRHRTTRCSYLNYIKQPETEKNKGKYVITNWGWQALRGEPVPKVVRYFRGELIGRDEETTTLSQMLSNTKTLKRVSLHKQGLIDDYDPNEWRDYGGVMSGKLL